MAVIERHTAVVQADYGQFYLQSGEEWLSEMVPSFGIERHLWSSGGFASVFTAGQFPRVELEVEVHDRPPGEPGPTFDHVVSTSLESVGTLKLLSWDPPVEGPDAEIDLAPGTWRLRVNWSDVERADIDPGAPEALLLQLWREPWSDPTVERWWGPWRRPDPVDVSPDGLRQIEGFENFEGPMRDLRPVGGFGHPFPPLPRRTGTSVYSLFQSPADGSWWVHAQDGRALLREIPTDDASALRSLPSFVPVDDAR